MKANSKVLFNMAESKMLKNYIQQGKGNGAVPERNHAGRLGVG